MMRVGFVLNFDDGWIGGVNYFHNLLSALYELPNRKIEVVVFTGVAAPQEHFDGFPSIKIVRSHLFDKGTWQSFLRRVFLKFFLKDLLLIRLLRKNKIKVLSHSGSLGRQSEIITIAWIPDFQHVHLPNFFSAEEIAARNLTFQKWCKECNAVIVSSDAGRQDLVNYAPYCKDKSRVLKFAVPFISNADALPSRSDLECKFNFSGRYLLLPNQFWRHKNHSVVIEALGLLKSQNRDVLVIATGKKEDYRYTGYFDSLMSRVEELKISNCFRALGLVSKSDLSALMINALAVINPSYFEGWSTTVEEAKALGKQVLLSDIPVHREQNPEYAAYFPPDDAKTLAYLIQEIWTGMTDQVATENVHALTQLRRRFFAERYQDIVLDTYERCL